MRVPAALRARKDVRRAVPIGWAMPLSADGSSPESTVGPADCHSRLTSLAGQRIGQIESFAVVTQPVKVHSSFRHHNGNPQYFDNAAGIKHRCLQRCSYTNCLSWRNRPAQQLPGDGYFDVDTGLSKNWRISEFGALKFGWEDV